MRKLLTEDGFPQPLTEEELREFRKTEPIRERVTNALLREFLDDEGEKKLTEEEVIEGFRDFKKLFEEFIPHLF